MTGIPRVDCSTRSRRSASMPSIPGSRMSMRTRLGWRSWARRTPSSREERATALAVELVSMKVDLIFATYSGAVRAANEATITIPIVMAAVANLERQGLVVSHARPAGNVTGPQASVLNPAQSFCRSPRTPSPNDRSAVSANPQAGGIGDVQVVRPAALLCEPSPRSEDQAGGRGVGDRAPERHHHIDVLLARDSAGHGYITDNLTAARQR